MRNDSEEKAQKPETDMANKHSSGSPTVRGFLIIHLPILQFYPSISGLEQQLTFRQT